MEYIDEYSACEETYTTLCIYSGEQASEYVTSKIGIAPSRITKISSEKPTRKNGWFLSSEGELESKDSRRHIDWLLDQIEPKSIELLELQSKNFEMYVFCYWASSSGNGGPTISPKQMKRLINLNLEVSWDVYF